MKGNPGQRTRKGQTAVEFALVIIVLMALIYGIIEIGRLILINAELENAVREGVHYAALHPDNATGDYLRVNVIGPRLTLIDRNSTDLVISDAGLPHGVGFGLPVMVTATYQYNSWINFVPDMRT